MMSSSRAPIKLGGVLVGLAVLCSSSQHVRGVETVFINASSRLVSVDPMTGEMCAFPAEAALSGPFTPAEDIPINPVTVALRMNVRALQPLAAAPQQQQQQQGARAFTPAPGVPLPGPPAGINAAKHAAVRARMPLRRIYDRYPQYSAVAVDPARDEVVLQDENLFQIQVFNR